MPIELRTASLPSNTKESLRVALVQLNSQNSVQENAKQILKLIQQIPQDVDLITLPENAFFIRFQDSDQMEYLDTQSGFWDPFKDFCIQRKCHLHVGATPILHKNEKWNSTLWIDPSGKLTAPYQKMHLFDIYLEDRPPILESHVFKHGGQPQILDLNGWKVGLTICYDIRFAELFSYYQSQGVDMILAPSSFLVETGKKHWDILLRARAIESQCFIVAAAQGGQHGPTRQTYGHSLIVSPWGDKKLEILDQGRSSYQVCELYKDEILSMRTQIPMQNHRRIKISFS